MVLKDPLYRPSAIDLDILQRDVRTDVLKQPRILTRLQRVALSDRLATEAAQVLLKQLEPIHEVADANNLRFNQPGYDFLVDGKVKIQVKGATFVEGWGWAVKGEKSLDFDVLLYVDIGVVVDGNVGRLAKKPIPVKPHADFYVVPISVVRAWLDRRLAINARGNNLYLWKTKLNPNTAEHRNQTVEFVDWRGRFDVIDNLVNY
jgi:hypothetical protein